MDQATASYVHDFEDGHREQGDLLGGKGANLAEMTRLGLPVPPGFTIDTEACRAYLTTGEPPRQPRQPDRQPPGGTRGADGSAPRRPDRPSAGLGALRARSSPCPE